MKWQWKVIGLGCDGTSALKFREWWTEGPLWKRYMPWIIVNWCLTHRLELSIKDALKTTFFVAVDELLLQIFYVYKKSPKNFAKLKEIVEELKQCFEDYTATQRWSKAFMTLWDQVCGSQCSCFIASHQKVWCLPWSIDIIRSVKSTDRQKLKGYVLRWSKCKVLLGCAFFHDVLKPVAIFLQDYTRGWVMCC